MPAPDPAILLERLAGLPYPVFLDATADRHDLGRWSYLAADPVAFMRGSADDWPACRRRIRHTIGQPNANSPAPFAGGWIGWFSYELGRAFDRQPVSRNDPMGVPDLSLALYDCVVAWDHVTGNAWLISSGIDANGVPDTARALDRGYQLLQQLSVAPIKASAPPRPRQRVAFSRDFTPVEYQETVSQVIELVLAGDIFQANLSQRFSAPFTGNPLDLHAALRRHAPAALGAFLDHGSHQVVSASPERFLRYDPVTRAIETRPIKGTRRRDPDPETDAQLARELSRSEKDRAENVMIVDLLRNDLHRVADADSVAVPTLCRLDTHRTVHHLASIVTARLRADCDVIDLLEATFPGGSVTGAPKLRAMAILAELEPVVRGVYCGAIGWIGLDGAMHLSLAIRTLTVANGMVSIHAGGGVTALSESEPEYQETLDKARAMLTAVEESA